ncbi:BrnT family toxin [Actinobacillus genomosp. 1]|uniref:BrnT family toxin n=1 Tax=Actinobacillus genomosp. 1 TaxID=254839 RepID=UPI0024412728|nr:BrnT family toxin [Actinobacillus genomosp. 1]WGE91052.1 BrnT family toxin [Actinobacillus genomosp. 1]
MFEYDPNKSRINKEKHGIDFEEAKQLWKDEQLLTFTVMNDPEHRLLAIGQINKKHWSAIFTVRGKNVRLISVRRSRKKEVELYENT